MAWRKGRLRLWSSMLLLTGGVLFTPLAARAEWTTQTISLHPGWNAVFLEVQPDDALCDTVFAGVPVQSVWKWNRKVQLQQFVRNPNELLPKSPDWLVYFPPNEARAFLSTLFAVSAGQPYLVQVAGENTVEMTVAGRAASPRMEWLPDSFNLAGFYLDPTTNVSFKNFLKSDAALAGQPVYRILASGESIFVKPDTENLKPGEAYWIYSKGPCSFAGPFHAATESLQGLNFGKEFNEGGIELENTTDAPKTITLRMLPSERPAANKTTEALPTLAGEVALSYGKLIGWAPIENKMEFTVPAKSKQRLPIAIRRSAMVPLGAKATTDGQYESVLQLSDGSGGQFRLPVKAVADPSPTGLWVGNVTLTKVSEVARPNDLTTTPTSSEFNFRVIVHVDELGNPTLLQKVYLLQEEQQLDTSVPPKVVRPERYVLVTRDDLLDGLSGVTIRDGKFVGRRITAPAFSGVDLDSDTIADPVPMVGNVTPGATLQATLNTDYQDPLNPFVHIFHPDHDNLDERYENTRAEGKESFSFSRALTLSFETQDPEQLGLPEWGDTVIGGTYREEITGVHKRTIRVEGTFRLSRVSRIGKLNDVH